MSSQILYAIPYLNEALLSQLKDAASGWSELKIIDPKIPEAEYRSHLEGADFVVGNPKADWLEGTPVRVLQLGSAGFDGYLGHGIESRPNFTLCNIKGAASIGIAENTLSMMLFFSRRILRHMQGKQNRQFNRTILNGEEFFCGELNGSTACVVGIGSTGSQIARVCSGLQMRVIAVDIEGIKKPDWVEKLYTTDELYDALAEADHVVLAVTGGPTTRDLVDKRFLDAMKPGAYLYNSSRGTVIVEPELIEALKNGHLAGAGLDVFREEPLPQDSPLWDLDNVIITPHIACIATNYGVRMCDIFLKNLNNFRNGLPLFNIVPELSTTEVHPKSS